MRDNQGKHKILLNHSTETVRLIVLLAMKIDLKSLYPLIFRIFHKLNDHVLRYDRSDRYILQWKRAGSTYPRIVCSNYYIRLLKKL